MSIGMVVSEFIESGIRNRDSFIQGNLQYMQMTKGDIQFLLYIWIPVVGKSGF